MPEVQQPKKKSEKSQPYWSDGDRRRLCQLLLRQQPLNEWARHFLPNYFTLQSSGLHRYLFDKLGSIHKERGTRLSVVAPRGSAKSTCASLACPLRAALNRLEPYTVLISDTGEQAAGHLKAIKSELEDNEELAAQYPEATGEGPIWREDEITLRNGAVIKALGTRGKIRGRRERENRPSFVILDDPENDEHITSEHQRDTTREWFNRSVMNAGTADTNYVVLGTALHSDCLALVTGRSAGWHGRTFQAIENWPARMDLWAVWETIYRDWQDTEREAKADAFYAANRQAMDAGSQLLWPERESLLTLMELRATIGHAAFESEKQGNPINPSACEWPADYFDGNGFWFEQWPAQMKLRVCALDPSKGKESKIGDYAALVDIGRTVEGIIYVDADIRRLPIDQIVSNGVEHARVFRPDAFGIEINQFQELLAPEFKRVAAAQGVHMPIWGAVNTVNKLVRIRRLGTYLAQRKLRFKARSPGAQLLVQQLKDFPVGDHDDGPDALWMAIELAIEVWNGGAQAGRQWRLVA